MARIETYVNDDNVQDDDRLLGTDSEGNETKNFRVADLTEYVSAKIGMATVIDEVPTENSENPVQSGGVYVTIAEVVEEINEAISELEPIVLDAVPTDGSTNGVQSNGVFDAIAAIPVITFDSLPTNGSTNAVTSNGVYDADVVILAAAENYTDTQITNLINGSPITGDTLKKLHDRLAAQEAIVGGTTPDGDSVVDTVAELLAVLSTYPEGTDLFTLVQGKVAQTDVYNALDYITSGKVLDARQGKVLNDLITALSITVAGKEASTNKTSVVATNEASTTLFPTISGIVNWIVNTFNGFIGTKTTLVDADTVVIGDSADSNKTKKITWANLKTALGNFTTGTGTTNKLTKWTGTSTQGDSNISDTGTLVTVSSDIESTGSGTLLANKLLNIKNSAANPKFEVNGSNQVTFFRDANIESITGDGIIINGATTNVQGGSNRGLIKFVNRGSSLICGMEAASINEGNYRAGIYFVDGRLIRFSTQGQSAYLNTMAVHANSAGSQEGHVSIGTETINESTKFNVVSTLMGSSPFPRMTSAQRLAIATPMVGLHVYQTDGTEGVYVNKSGGWVLAY